MPENKSAESRISDKKRDKIQEKLLSNESFTKLSSFYSLFADPTRLKIICLLMHNRLCVGDIAGILEASPSAVSHQLAILRQHDIVTYDRVGKSVLYTLTDNHIKDLFSTGLEHASERDDVIYEDRKKKGY